MNNNCHIDLLKTRSKEDLLDAIKNSSDYVKEDADIYGFLADPAKHSLSPRMYNNAFRKLGINALYFSSTIPEECIREAIYRVRKFGIKGVNISMPHKESVVDELYEINDMAELCEAVNTVVWENGDLKGYNTDLIGGIEAIKDLFLLTNGNYNNSGDEKQFGEKRGSLGETINQAAVLGLGGAGRAVITGLAKEGVKEINIFVRKNRPFEYSKYLTKVCDAFPGVTIRLNALFNQKELRGCISNSQLLVNATNVGMGELEGESLIPDSSYLHSDLKVMDVIYAPEKTLLLRQAEEAGCAYINGLPMLLHQGEEAFKLFTGIETELYL